MILILIDIYLHEDGNLQYSNYFHKEKFKTIPEEILNAVEDLVDELDQNIYSQEKLLYSTVLQYYRHPQKTPDCIEEFELFSKNSFFQIHSSMIYYYLVIWSMRMKMKEKVKQNLISLRNQQYRPRRLFDEYYFKGQLLCVDVLMNKDKLKPAAISIEKILGVNKSCLLAYEYRIILNEKQKESLVQVYEEAFELTCELDPNMGYNYAQQLFLGGNLQQSFKVCKKVLQIYPKFVKIEKDVLIPVKKLILKNC